MASRMMTTKTGDIDKYIANFPPETRKRLKAIRSLIKKAAPKATEAIKYGIPTFVLNGNLIHFAAFKNHLGLYPAPREHEDFKEELSAYEGGKGTLQLPLDKPLPLELIGRIVKFRIRKNLERKKVKGK